MLTTRRNIGIALMLALLLVFAACQPQEAAPATETPATEAGTATEAPATETGATEDAGQTTGDDNVLVVGLEAGYAPFNWSQLDDSNGAVPIEGTQEFANGFDVAIAKKVAEGLGRELRIQKIVWDGLEPALRSGTIDAIIAGMSPLEERKTSIDFSDPYYVSEFVLVTMKDGKYAEAKTLEDFSGATVTGQLNTSHYTVIDQIPGVNKDQAMADFGAMRVALQSGIIDAYVSERPEGISASEANPSFVYITPNPNFEAPIEEVSVSVALKKGSPLLDQVNEILAGITQEERDELMKTALQQQPTQ